MPKKSIKNQSLRRRQPTQERAQSKIEHIFEAATRIIDEDGLEGLTTNRIAEVAGISIGTLYQYFDNKSSIIYVLGKREMTAVTDKIIATLTLAASGTPIDLTKVLIDAVFNAFNGRSKVHRVLLENAFAQGRVTSVDSSPNLIAGLLASYSFSNAEGQVLRLSPAQAFVLTHAFTGVTRAAVALKANEIPPEEIKNALQLLIKSFVINS